MDVDFGGVSSALVALSGGVDSSVLLRLTKDAGIFVEAACVVSEFTAEADVCAAKSAAEREGVAFSVLSVSLLEDSAIVANPKDRCYLCKKRMAAVLLAHAKRRGLSAVFEGTNADDGVRPGFFALQESGVKSPLLRVSKADIIRAAEGFGILVLPPSACLATRIPYGIPLSVELLKRVEEAEQLLRAAGVCGVLRVRLKNMHEAVVETECVALYSAKFFEDELACIGIENVVVDEYRCGGAQWISRQ